MTIRAVLFDIGGPLDLDFAWELAIDSAIAAAWTIERIPVDEQGLAAASARAVSAFAPDAYAAMIEDLCGGDAASASRVHQRMRSTVQHLDAFQLRPGIADLLSRLASRGLRLATVANQPAAAL